MPETGRDLIEVLLQMLGPMVNNIDLILPLEGTMTKIQGMEIWKTHYRSKKMLNPSVV